MAKKYLVGIDEVGRGSLVGPVTVAAVFLPQKLPLPRKLGKIPLKDSKKLNFQQREAWFKYFKNNPHIFYALKSISSKIIDKTNISRAANSAGFLALTKLFKQRRVAKRLKSAEIKVFLDGGLYLKGQTRNQKQQKYCSKTIPGHLKIQTIPKADEKIKAVKIASIVAKVHRDRYLIKLHQKYPHYDFHKNKGYGTKKHLKAIKKYGPSEVHRLTFIKKYVKFIKMTSGRSFASFRMTRRVN